MKKIVALVLALVLALSLATVAFAYSYSSTETKGTTSTLVKADKYALYDINGNTKKVATFTSYTTMSTKVVVEDNETDTTYIPAYYTADVAERGGVVNLFEATKECANYRLFKGDDFVGYVNVDTAKDYLPAVDKFIEGDDSGDCGTYAVDVYVVDGVAHEAQKTGGKYAVYDGKLVQYGTEKVSAVAHTWTMSKVEYKGTDAKGHQIPVAITCAACGEKFDIVKTLPATYKGSFVTLAEASSDSYWRAARDNWKLVNSYNLDDTNRLQFRTGDYANYMIITGAVTAAAGSTSTTGVSSAKTFDAGIAMYVGMSLMAVTGSAVVIGKKKEF